MMTEEYKRSILNIAKNQLELTGFEGLTYRKLAKMINGVSEDFKDDASKIYHTSIRYALGTKETIVQKVVNNTIQIHMNLFKEEETSFDQIPEKYIDAFFHSLKKRLTIIATQVTSRFMRQRYYDELLRQLADKLADHFNQIPPTNAHILVYGIGRTYIEYIDRNCFSQNVAHNNTSTHKTSKINASSSESKAADICNLELAELEKQIDELLSNFCAELN